MCVLLVPWGCSARTGGAIRNAASEDTSGAGTDYGLLDAVRVRPGRGRPRAWPGVCGRVLRGGEGLPVGLVLTAPRAAGLTQQNAPHTVWGVLCPGRPGGSGARL